MKPGRRFVFPQHGGTQLPLHIESIGFEPHQYPIVRHGGYPYYHWLQVASGEGAIQLDGHAAALGPNMGILLYPNVAHEYSPLSDCWETLYLTFDGSIASNLLSMLGLSETTFFHWESGTPLDGLLPHMLDNITMESDVFGLQISTEVYHFLITLQKYGQLHKHGPVSSNLVILRPLLDWMETHYSNPSTGLEELAQIVKVTPRRLIALFRSTFGMTPYSYFLMLRLRKAKEMLISEPKTPVKIIAAKVGFRDSSHFVATFRKQAGITPEQFRRLNG